MQTLGRLKSSGLPDQLVTYGERGQDLFFLTSAELPCHLCICLRMDSHAVLLHKGAA